METHGIKKCWAFLWTSSQAIMFSHSILLFSFFLVHFLIILPVSDPVRFRVRASQRACVCVLFLLLCERAPHRVTTPTDLHSLIDGPAFGRLNIRVVFQINKRQTHSAALKSGPPRWSEPCRLPVGSWRQSKPFWFHFVVFLQSPFYTFYSISSFGAQHNLKMLDQFISSSLMAF